MFETGLRIDGNPVRVNGSGFFSVTLDREKISSPRFEALVQDVERYKREIEVKRERQRLLLARRSVGKTKVWVRSSDRKYLEPAVYRGRHATTGSPLLTFTDGSKPIGKRYYTLYVDLTQEQVNEINGLVDQAEETAVRLKASSEKAVRDNDLSADARDGKIKVIRRKYSRSREEVAEASFTANGVYLSTIVNGDVLSADSMHELERAVIRRLHPAYGRQVWIVDIGTMKLRDKQEAFQGDVRFHAVDGERSYSLLLFEDRADAEEYLSLRREREEAVDRLTRALAALPQLEKDPDEDSESDEPVVE